MSVSEVLAAVINFSLNTNRDEFCRLFYEGMHQAYAAAQYRTFTENPLRWYQGLDSAYRAKFCQVIDKQAQEQGG